MSALAIDPAWTLRLTHHVAAPVEAVFRAWIDPEALKLWWGPGGFTVPHAETDPRPGGRYRIAMQSPGRPVQYLCGAYVELVPPRRLV